MTHWRWFMADVEGEALHCEEDPMEKDVMEPQVPQEQTTVRVPFTEREVTVPGAIIIPLAPLWRGLRWLALEVDRLAAEAARRLKEWR